MSFAVFIEGEALVNGAKPQVLVFPTDTGATTFFRESDGGKGGTNRWQRLAQTGAATLTWSGALTAEPSAVLVSDTDVQQFQRKGFPSVLSAKALRAHSLAPATTLTADVYTALFTEVAARDNSLNRFLRDARRARPVVIPAAASVAVVAPTPVEPTYSTVSVAAPTHSNAMASFIPDKAVADRYIHRKISGRSDFEIFDWARYNNRNVLLYGPTGPGKTSCALAYAAQHGLRVAMVNGSAALEPSHYLGKYVVDENTGSLRWQDGVITEVVRHGGVILRDESGFISNKIITPLYPLLQYGTRHLTLLDHNGETIKAHPDLLIVATMNPHYAGNQALNEALRNRYSIQLNWGYDDAVEKQLVPQKSLRDLAKQLRAAEAKEEILTPTPTNALTEFAEIAAGLGLEFAFANFINRYSEEEQSSLKYVLDTHRANIEADFGGAAVTSIETDEFDALAELADISIDL